MRLLIVASLLLLSGCSKDTPVFSLFNDSHGNSYLVNSSKGQVWQMFVDPKTGQKVFVPCLIIHERKEPATVESVVGSLEKKTDGVKKAVREWSEGKAP